LEIKGVGRLYQTGELPNPFHGLPVNRAHPEI
jgi:hypothetical protein